jgi:hypothetical protein
MRAIRFCGYWLLLVSVLGNLGCGRGAYVKKGPEIKTNTITINNCNATPDSAQVSINDTLTWVVDPTDSHTYSINFPHNKPISSATVPPGQGQQVAGDFACKHGHWLSDSFCVYPYNLIQVKVKTCPDPGVHIVP